MQNDCCEHCCRLLGSIVDSQCWTLPCFAERTAVNAVMHRFWLTVTVEVCMVLQNGLLSDCATLDSNWLFKLNSGLLCWMDCCDHCPVHSLVVDCPWWTVPCFAEWTAFGTAIGLHWVLVGCQCWYLRPCFAEWTVVGAAIHWVLVGYRGVWTACWHSTCTWFPYDNTDPQSGQQFG